MKERDTKNIFIHTCNAENISTAYQGEDLARDTFFFAPIGKTQIWLLSRYLSTFQGYTLNF